MRNNEEHRIQAGIVSSLAHVKACKWLHAIPNGGARDARTGKMLKAEGVKRGILDLFLPYPVVAINRETGGYSLRCGLYMEVKTSKGRLSKEQKEYIEYLATHGYAHSVVRSVQDGVNCVLDYIAGKPIS